MEKCTFCSGELFCLKFNLSGKRLADFRLSRKYGLCLMKKDRSLCRFISRHGLLSFYLYILIMFSSYVIVWITC